MYFYSRLVERWPDADNFRSDFAIDPKHEVIYIKHRSFTLSYMY